MPDAPVPVPTPPSAPAPSFPVTPPRYRGKFRNKVFLLMMLIGIVPLVVAAALTYYVVTDSHRDDVAKLESAVLTEKSEEIQNFIDQDLLGETRVLVPYSPTNQVATSAEEYVIQNTLTVLPFVQSESFVDLAGQEQVRIDRTHLSGYPTSSLEDMSGSPAFQVAKAGDSYLGAISYEGSIPLITFASPVKDNNGETLGILMGTADLSVVQQIVASTTIGNTGYVYLVDQSGALIASGDNSGFAAKGITPGSTSTGALPIVTDVLKGQTLTTAATQMRYANLTGTPVVGAALPMSEYGGEQWGLVAEWPTSEADAVVAALLFRDAIILIVVILAIILLSILAALFVVRPIKQLEAGTERVAQGKFNEGVYIKTGDELEELGDSFNGMVEGLKQLEELKDEFVFIAAHELRTPVAAMKGYLQLILEGTTGAITDATREFIEKVVASNQRLIQLVNDLLEVARSQAGRLTIKVASVDIRPSISSTLDELKSLADEKSVVMNYAPAADTPNVLADADRVKEVVVNLVGNAIKYMGGAGTIAITHERAALPNGATGLATRIADTGLGISKEAQEKLFTKFYRVQTDKTREITGTGLGLFIVKEIIEKMNGTIGVESEEGKGSAFTFILPVA